MNELWAKDSKIWDVLLVLSFGGVMWLNASNFDHTELKAWGEYFMIFMGYKKIRG